MKKKKILIGLIILCLLIACIIGLITLKNNTKKAVTTPKSNNEEQIKYNTNEEVTENKLIENILFSDIECTFDGNNSLLTYKITNQSTSSINLNEYELTVRDKNNNILAIIVPNIPTEIKPNETIETGNAIDIDLTEAYKLEISIPNK